MNDINLSSNALRQKRFRQSKQDEIKRVNSIIEMYEPNEQIDAPARLRSINRAVKRIEIDEEGNIRAIPFGKDYGNVSPVIDEIEFLLLAIKKTAAKDEFKRLQDAKIDSAKKKAKERRRTIESDNTSNRRIRKLKAKITALGG